MFLRKFCFYICQKTTNIIDREELYIKSFQVDHPYFKSTSLIFQKYKLLIYTYKDVLRKNHGKDRSFFVFK